MCEAETSALLFKESFLRDHRQTAASAFSRTYNQYFFADFLADFVNPGFAFSAAMSLAQAEYLAEVVAPGSVIPCRTRFTFNI